MKTLKKVFTNAADRKMARKLLKDAKPYIAEGDCTGVCTAISYAEDEHGRRSAEDVGARIRSVISERIGYRTYVTDWLERTTSISSRDIEEHAVAYRLLWIDSMIAELK